MFLRLGFLGMKLHSNQCDTSEDVEVRISFLDRKGLDLENELDLKCMSILSFDRLAMAFYMLWFVGWVYESCGLLLFLNEDGDNVNRCR